MADLTEYLKLHSYARFLKREEYSEKKNASQLIKHETCIHPEPLADPLWHNIWQAFREGGQALEDAGYILAVATETPSHEMALPLEIDIASNAQAKPDRLEYALLYDEEGENRRTELARDILSDPTKKAWVWVLIYAMDCTRAILEADTWKAANSAYELAEQLTIARYLRDQAPDVAKGMNTYKKQAASAGAMNDSTRQREWKGQELWERYQAAMQACNTKADAYRMLIDQHKKEGHREVEFDTMKKAIQRLEKARKKKS